MADLMLPGMVSQTPVERLRLATVRIVSGPLGHRTNPSVRRQGG